MQPKRTFAKIDLRKHNQARALAAGLRDLRHFTPPSPDNKTAVFVKYFFLGDVAVRVVRSSTTL